MCLNWREKYDRKQSMCATFISKVNNFKTSVSWKQGVKWRMVNNKL